MKFGLFSPEGFPVAFYSEEIHGSAIPAEAVALTDGQWADLVVNQGFRRWDGAEVSIYDPPPSPPVVPSQVSRAQAKIALNRAGLLPAVEAKVSETGGETAIWYADALSWRRDNPNVIALGAGLGLTPEQIDDMFRTAAAIDA